MPTKGTPTPTTQTNGSGEMQGKLSVDEIVAHGDVSTRILGIKIAGSIVVLLTLGSLVFSFVNFDRSKDLWLITGPIIGGSLVYFVGQQKGKK